MTITDIKVRRLLPAGKMKAIVSITFDNALAVHDIKVIEGDGRLFAAMPSRRDENGCYRDIVHPITQAERTAIEQDIIKAYKQALISSESSDQ